MFLLSFYYHCFSAIWLWYALMWFTLFILCDVLWALWICRLMVLIKFGKKFLLLFLSLLLLGLQSHVLLDCLVLSHKSPRPGWFFSSLFFSLASVWILSFAVSSSSLVLSFQGSNMLSLSRGLLISETFLSFRRYKKELNGIVFFSSLCSSFLLYSWAHEVYL